MIRVSIHPLRRLALIGLGLWMTLATPQSATAQMTERAVLLSQAMEAANARDWSRARALSAQLPNQPARDVVEWTMLRGREGSFADYVSFLTRNADWPGMPLLAARGEASIPETARPADVRSYFANHAPQTGIGSLRLAAALRADGRGAEADALIVTAWQNFGLDAETDALFLAQYSQLLAPHHTTRVDNLLWAGNTSAARRMLPLLPEDWRLSSEARILLRDDQDGVDAAIEAVPADFRNGAGLSYERFLWRSRKGRQESAIELMLERSTSHAALGKPEEWGFRRRAYARDLMRDGRNEEAYRLAANHFIGRGDTSVEDSDHFSDLEWLAGFIALRKLNRPDLALTHFQQFETAVGSPISMGRAGYWQGRALEALGRDAEARAAYAKGAQHQTAFYGQLAAERANLPSEPALLAQETFPAWRDQAFMSSDVLAAALYLQEAGDLYLAGRFMVHLAERLTYAERGALADLALHLNEPHIALRLAKFAAGEGQVLYKAYHPTTDLSGLRLPIDPALALAITRRESEFNQRIVSPAGALGLMQLMPATGRAMAEAEGVTGFSTDKLLSDPALNTRLGSAYLARQIGDFGDNITLVSAAYNAGPSRARAWIERFGDPRSQQVDIVDWIEMIPFTETRNYIMRVTESLLVYEMMLAGRALPLRPTERLTRR